MKSIDRIMPGSPKKAGKRFQIVRPGRRQYHAMTPGVARREYLSLSPEAMDVVRALAEQTNSSPDDVLRQSVTLYKMTLDAHRAKGQAAQMPAG